MNPHSVTVLTLLTVACSGDGSETTETGTPTTPTGSVPTGPIGVTVTDGETVFSGATVAFHDASGAVVGTAETDALGQASFAAFPSGGAVTVAVVAETQAAYATVLALEPDDAVVVDPMIQAPAYPLGSMEVTVEAYGGAETYVLWSPCFTGSVTPGTPTDVQIFAPCVDNQGGVSFLALASDADGTLAYALAADVPFTTDPVPSVTLGDWQTGLSSFEMTASNAAPTTEQAEMRHFEVRRGTAVYMGSPDPRMPAPGEGFTAVADPVVGALDIVGIRAAVEYEVPRGYSTSAFTRGFDSVPAGYGVDLTDDLYPRVHASELDRDAREVRWTVDGTIEDADFVVAELDWEDDGVDHRWSILGPPGIALALPELPASWSSPSDPLGGAPAIEIWQHSMISDYGGIRETFPPKLMINPLDAPGEFFFRTARTGG